MNTEEMVRLKASGWSVKQIASKAGIAVSLVYSRLYAASPAGKQSAIEATKRNRLRAQGKLSGEGSEQWWRERGF